MIFLGQYYGWQPLAETIPPREFDELCSLDAHTAALLANAYALDDNRLEAAYCIRKPREFAGDWNLTESELTACLHALYAAMSTDQQNRLAPYCTQKSMTHQEIDMGLLHAMADAGNVFCVFRTVHGDADPALYPPEMPPEIEALRRQVQQQVDASHIFFVDLSAQEYRQQVQYPASLCNWVYQNLSQTIDSIIASNPPTAKATAESMAQRLLLSQYKTSPIRMEPPSAIPQGVSVLFTGEDTPELAAAVPSAFVRFAGQTPASESMRGLLSGVLAELFPIDENTRRAAIRAIDDADDSMLFHTFFQHIASVSRPITLVIDKPERIYHFNEIYRWQLRNAMPSNFSLVLTTTEANSGLLAELGFPCRRIEPPTVQALMKSLLQALAAKGRTLNQAHQTVVTDALGIEPSLAKLRMVYPLLAQTRGDTPVQDVEKLFHLPLQSLLNHYIKDECGHLCSMTDAAIALLSATRDGLHVTELERLLSGDSTVMQAVNLEAEKAGSPQVDSLPPAMLRRLLFDLRLLLRQGEIDGIETLRLRDDITAELSTDCQKARTVLKKLFDGDVSRRALREQTWQRYQLGDAPELGRMLQNANFILQKQCDLSDLLADYDRCAAIAQEQSVPMLIRIRDRLRLLAPALRSRPDLAAQTLYGGLRALGEEMEGLKTLSPDGLAVECLGGDLYGTTPSIALENGRFIACSPNGQLIMLLNGYQTGIMEAATLKTLYAAASTLQESAVLAGALADSGDIAVMDTAHHVYWNSACFHCDGPPLCHAGKGGVIAMSGGKLTAHLQNGEIQTLCEGQPVCFSLQGAKLLFVLEDAFHIMYFCNGRWTEECRLPIPEAGVMAASLSPDGKRLLALYRSRRLTMQRTDNGETILDQPYLSGLHLQLPRLPRFCGMDGSGVIWMVDEESNIGCYDPRTGDTQSWRSAVSVNHPRIWPVALAAGKEGATLLLPAHALIPQRGEDATAPCHIGGTSDCGILSNGTRFTLMENDARLILYPHGTDAAKTVSLGYPLCACACDHSVVVALTNHDVFVGDPEEISDILHNLPFSVACRFLDYRNGMLFMGSSEGIKRSKAISPLELSDVCGPFDGHSRRLDAMAALSDRCVAVLTGDILRQSDESAQWLATAQDGQFHTVANLPHCSSLCANQSGTMISAYGLSSTLHTVRIADARQRTLDRVCRAACFIGDRLLACSFTDTPFLELLDSETLETRNAVYLPDAATTLCNRGHELLCGLRCGRAVALQLGAI